MAQADHFLNEDHLLLVVEAGEKRLGGIGDVTLVHRAVVEKLGLVAHLLDDVVRRVALGARNSQVEPVGAIMAEIVHGAVERGPVLLLLTRQIELGLDPIDVRVAVGDNLLARQLRLAGLG